jgi:hypothetical protein
MTDVIKPTPQNPLLGLLAKALYGARDIMSPAPDSWAASKGINLADFILGDAPEEVENWSYGSAPFRVPPLSPIPQAQTQVVERDGKKERKNRAFMAADAAAFAPFGPLDNLVGGAAKGAIRLGGAPEAVASHTTQPTKSEIKSIAREGLFAPSIGLTAKGPSDYHSRNPHIVWRAGELDKKFPDSAPPEIFNRDAFVWNPIRESEQSIQDQYKTLAPYDAFAARLADLLGDSRFTQMAPDKGSHTASILASPKFKNLAEWEASPYGMAALETMGGGPGGLKTVDNYSNLFSSALRKHGIFSGTPEATQLLEQYPHLTKSGLNIDLIKGSPLGDTYSLARNAPSAMAELKVYAPSVPAGPDVASVYLPRYEEGLAEPWRNAGYEVYSPQSLHGLSGKYATSLDDAPLHLLAPPSGAAPPSHAEGLRMADEARAKGYTPGWSAPGLKAPAEPFDQLVYMAETGWSKAPETKLSSVPPALLQSDIEDFAEDFGLDTGSAKKLLQDYYATTTPGETDLTDFAESWLEKKGLGPVDEFALPDPDTDIAAQAAHAQAPLKAADKNFGFPEGHPAIKIFQKPSHHVIADLETALGVQADSSVDAFNQIGQKLGLTPEESAKAYKVWMNDLNATAVDALLPYLK